MYTEPSGVHVVPLADLIHCRHQIQVVLAAPVTQHRIDELLAVSGRTARVHRQRNVTGARQHLMPRHEGIVKGAIRPAVYLQHQRILLGAVKSRRVVQPALNVPAIAADAEFFHIDRRVLGQPCVVVRCQPPPGGPGSVGRADVQVPRHGRPRRRHHNAAGIRIQSHRCDHLTAPGDRHRLAPAVAGGHVQ